MPQITPHNSNRVWEDQRIFFIYDRRELQKSDSSPEDGLLFFSPTTVATQDQYSLVGQFVGMLSFTEGMLNMRPRCIRLKNGKFVVKSIDTFTMFLGGALSDPDNLLLEQLAYLYGIFEFFHNSFNAVHQAEKTIDNMRKRMFEIWNCYLPLVKHYGEDLLSYFHTIQYTMLEDTNPRVYLKALQLLEACQRRSDALCGCIFSEEKVIVSQVHPDLLRYLSFLKPGQIHVPNNPVEVEGNLPHGVRIFQVYVSETSYQEIKHRAELTPYSLLKKADSLSSEYTISSGKANEEENETVAGPYIPSVEPGQINEDYRSLRIQNSTAKDSDNSVTLHEDQSNFRIFRSNSVANSASFAPRSNSFMDKFSSLSSDYNGPSQSSYPEEALPSPQDSEFDIVWDKKYGGELADLKESVRQFNMSHETTQKSTSSHEKVTDYLNSDFHETLPHSQNLGFRSSIRRSFSCESKFTYFTQDDTKEDVGPSTSKRPSTAYQGILGSGDPNSYTLESDDTSDKQCNFSSESSQHAPAFYCIDSQPQTERGTTCDRIQRNFLEADVNPALIDDHQMPLHADKSERSLNQEDSDTYEIGGDYLDSSCTKENCHTSPNHDEHGEKSEIIPKAYSQSMAASAASLCNAMDQKYENTNDVGHLVPIESQSNVPITLTNADHQDSIGISSKDKSFIDLSYKDIAQKSENGRAVGEHSLVNEGRRLLHDQKTSQEIKMLHLYVQSHSNTIILIFLDPKSKHDAQMLRSIYEIVVPQLGDLEATIQSSRNSSTKASKGDDFVYFMYDSDVQSYKGGCPFISQEDYTFAGAIKSIHSQFKYSSTMVDVTYKDYNKAVYGKRTLHQEIYYQPRGSYKAIQGAPTPYDISCVIDRRINGKLKKLINGFVL